MIIVAAMLGTSDANAANWDFTYYGHNGMNHSMVSCEFAERVAEEVLDLFGARDATVYCHGGIDISGIWPLSLDVEFTPAVVGNPPKVLQKRYPRFMDQGGCDFSVRMIDALVRKFPNVKVSSKHEFCFAPGGTYEYTFAISE